MTKSELATVEQPPIDDDAARQALEDILACRKQLAALLRTAEFQQMPVEHQIPLISLADHFEGALEMLGLHHKHTLKARDKITAKFQRQNTGVRR